MINTQHNKDSDYCPREEIFAYIDGELSPDEETNLECHFDECKICQTEVNAQKKVSNSLEIILEEEMKNIELPEDFSKIVKTKAESDVRGVREKRELSRALIIAATLLVLVIVGLGTQIGSVWETFERFVEQSGAVLSFVFHLIYDTALGLSLILKTLSQKFVFGSAVSILHAVVFLAVAFFSLSKLVLRFRRS